MVCEAEWPLLLGNISEDGQQCGGRISGDGATDPPKPAGGSLRPEHRRAWNLRRNASAATAGQQQQRAIPAVRLLQYGLIADCTISCDERASKTSSCIFRTGSSHFVTFALLRVETDSLRD
mmetsp:Transcript_65235/g.172907  ORF Transcript_65235/g.172907 Transcript_65235/m.172907 type:complete len:121 (+) Transcript_65235:459-821(+)